MPLHQRKPVNMTWEDWIHRPELRANEVGSSGKLLSVSDDCQLHDLERPSSCYDFPTSLVTAAPPHGGGGGGEEQWLPFSAHFHSPTSSADCGRTLV